MARGTREMLIMYLFIGFSFSQYTRNRGSIPALFKMGMMRDAAR
jgi:hypothetical protein